jgi:hypothetical protein
LYFVPGAGVVFNRFPLSRFVYRSVGMRRGACLLRYVQLL